MKLLLIFVLFLNLAFGGEVALTFDDSPMRDMELFSGKERATRLIKILENYKIQTVFFSVSNNLKKFDGMNRMKVYEQAGHLIANHTHTHPNYDKTSIGDYIDNFNEAHKKLSQFKNFRPWFRYPMLRHGNSKEKRDAMRTHLDKMGYKNGYVTLDIQDWFMASLLNQALRQGQKLNKNNLCRAYSEMIWDTMLYYDSKAIKLLSRSPKHTLLLHENDLAALCLESLIKKITSSGWKIISPEEALNDKIYTIQANTLFNNNGQIAALYFERKGVKLHDPWSYPWEEGKLIREEFQRRNVFKD